jgi:hypothetical protein
VVNLATNEIWKQASKPAVPTIGTASKTEVKTTPFTPTTFKKLSECEASKFVKVGVHGQAKTGKTKLLLDFPGPIYIIATEPGIVPLKSICANKEVYFVDVYEPDYEGTFEVDPTKSLQNIDNAVRTIRQISLADPKAVGTVGVDSVTDVWKWVQEWMKTEILKIDKTARVRQQWDWGFANTKYQNIIMQLCALPANLVLTAQDKEVYAGAGAPSGDYVARWQGQTQFWVDLTIGLTKLRNPKTGTLQFAGGIEDVRAPELVKHSGENIENIDYAKLLALYTDKVKA